MFEISIQWHSFKVTTISLHYCNARWPEDDCFSWNMWPSIFQQLILSVNEVVMTAIKDCFNTTNTVENFSFQATVLFSLSLSLPPSLSLSLWQTHTHTHSFE